MVTTPAPVTLTATLAAGLEVGHAARVYTDSSGGQPGRGYPAEVFGDAGAVRPVAFLGVPLSAK